MGGPPFCCPCSTSGPVCEVGVDRIGAGSAAPLESTLGALDHPSGRPAATVRQIDDLGLQCAGSGCAVWALRVSSSSNFVALGVDGQGAPDLILVSTTPNTPNLRLLQSPSNTLLTHRAGEA